jgi:DNA-binding response OmpR family regulator
MRKILIVDDEPNILKGFQRLLRHDYEILVARSGDEGIRLIEEGRPELILLDWQFKGIIEGKEVLNFSKKKYPKVPVWVITASADFVDEIKSSGADTCILKPCLGLELREKILRALPP